MRSGRQASGVAAEIALSGEFLDRVERRFGARPAGMAFRGSRRPTGAEPGAVATGEAQLVVGARSAPVPPFAVLGLIVVDEEHDGPKQEGVLYNARDMAVLRAPIEGAMVVLASATPSLESWANADAGSMRGSSCRAVRGRALPEMRAIDLRADTLEPGVDPDPLAAAVGERLEAGEQALLFLNRRGYAP